MTARDITVAFYPCRFVRPDWQYDLQPERFADFFAALGEELAPFGVVLKTCQDPAVTIDVRGYGDVLNAVRLRSSRDGIANLCLGHVIGASPHCDLMQDIRRGVNRLVFAPETVEPEGSNKVVCHNCGCGC
jgi:hypothetical protein